MLTPAIRRLSDKYSELQHKDFTERIKRLGNASTEELAKILRERETVEEAPV
jgi:hypothetical protein